MASTIDVTKPVSGNPTTSSVRDNFSAAKSEIETLQTDVTAVEGDITTLELADTVLADAIALKAPIASPTFTGTGTIPTAVITNLTFNGVVITATGDDLNATTGLTAALAAKAPLASPTFTGTTTIPTVDINGGAIDGTTVGANSASTGKFTTLTSDLLVKDAEYSGTVSISGTTPTLDLSAGNVFVHAGSSTQVVYSVSNTVAGKYHEFTIVVANTGGSTWRLQGPGLSEYSGDITAGSTGVIKAYTCDGGTTWLVIQNTSYTT